MIKERVLANLATTEWYKDRKHIVERANRFSGKDDKLTFTEPTIGLPASSSQSQPNSVNIKRIRGIMGTDVLASTAAKRGSQSTRRCVLVFTVANKQRQVAGESPHM
jgi:hypothetical protein